MTRRHLVRLFAAGAMVLGLVVPVRSAVPRADAAAGVVTDQRIGMLTAFFPSERDGFPGSTRPMWNRLASAGTDVGLVVVVENTVASIDYKDFVEREQGVGQTVLGTLAAQGESAMLASASFQRTQFGIDGVLLRSYSGTCGIGNEPSASLISGLRGLGLSTIAVETTGTPGSCYSTLADVLLTYNGALAAYGSVPARPSWLTGATPKLWHAVFGVADSQIAATVAASKAAGADYVVTSPDPGPTEATAVPDAAYWTALRQAVRGSGVSTAVESFPTVASQTLGLPIFGDAHPSWGMVSTASAAELGYVVVNAASGPGTVVQPALLAQVTSAKTAGRKVLGYIPLGYTPTGAASRTDGAILADVARWRDLYGVNGVFLDEVQPQCTVPGFGDIAARYTALASQMRSLIPGAYLALNPGRNIGECFVGAFDAIVTFEGPARAYASWTPSRWQDRYPAKHFWQLVYGASCPEVSGIMTTSRARNADLVYVTEQSGASLWTGAIDPGYFTTLRRSLASTARCDAPAVAPVTTAPRSAAPVVSAPPTSPRAAAPGAGQAGLTVVGVSSPSGPTPSASAPSASAPASSAIASSAIAGSASASSASAGSVPAPPSAPPLRHAQIAPGTAAPITVGPVPIRVAVRLRLPVTAVRG